MIKQNNAKQFAQAKIDEYDSWVNHDILDLVDNAKTMSLAAGSLRSSVTEMRFFSSARPAEFYEHFQQTDSPAASRPGFRMACQAAANIRWNIVHIDLKTAFLQGPYGG